MALYCLKKTTKCFILVLIIFVLLVECKRTSTGGRRTTRRTTPRSHQHDSNNYGGNHHTTQSSAGSHVTHHQTNNYQPAGRNNSSPIAPSAPIAPSSGNPLAPSAPIAPSSGNPGLGFENVHQRVDGQNGHQGQGGIGFENVQNRIPPQHNNNQQPALNVPLQNNQPTYNSGGFNQPHNAGGGYQPQPGTYNPGNVGPQNPHYPQSTVFQGGPGGYNQGQFGQPSPNVFPSGGYQGGGGYHSPNYAQSGSYYNPHYGPQNGAPPQIYQPIQQSSGSSSLLGYAGSFAGGYLIGKLTSGGGGGGGGFGGQSSNNNQYTVHHYHHNSDAVPKKIEVSNSSLVECSQNDTRGLCVPNTFPICLRNGTIMCVTHTPYTTPCGQNTSMACVITVLPCVNGALTCNDTGNFTNTAIFVPCISNVTVAKSEKLDVMSVPTINSSNNATQNKVELCVTAIAEPKKMESPVGSYFNLLANLVMLPFDMNLNQSLMESMDVPANVSTWVTRNKTDTIFVTT